MTPKFYRMAAVAGVLALAAAGCGSTQGGMAPTVRAAQTITTYDQVTVPVKNYQFSDEDQAVVRQAIQTKQNACLRRFGLAGNVPVTAADDLRPSFLIVTRYGLVDLALAKEFGYQPPLHERYAPLSGGKAAAWNATAAQQEVMSGKSASGGDSTRHDTSGQAVPQGGCAAEGEREVWPSYAQQQQAVDDLSNAGFHGIDVAPEARAALDGWNSCMKEYGYQTFNDRLQASNLAAKVTPSRARQIAVHDTTCAQRVNLIGVYMAVDTAYQEAYILANSAKYQQVAADNKTAVDSARAALGGS